MVQEQEMKVAWKQEKQLVPANSSINRDYTLLST